MPTTRTIVPDGVVTNTGPFVNTGGAASIQAALGDNNVSTYATKGTHASTDLLRLSMSTYALQANERCQRVRTMVLSFMSQNGFDAPGTYEVGLDIGGAWTGSKAQGVSSAGSFSPGLPPTGLAWELTANGAEWTQANIDAIRTYVDVLTAAVNPSSISVWELWVELDIHTKPTVAVATPLVGAITNNGNFPITWTYGGDGDAQSRFKVKVFTKAIAEAGGFNPETEVNVVHDSGWVTSSAASYNLPSSLLTFGAEYYVYVRVSKDFNGVPWDSDWSAGRLFKVNSLPSVNVLTPSGAVSTTSRPPVSWSYTDADGDTQTHYQVRIFSQPGGTWVGFDPDVNVANLIWDSGMVASTVTNSVIAPLDLANTTTYRAYVRITQSAFGLVSAWDFNDFNTAYVQPTVPVLTVFTEQGMARVKINIAAQVDNLLSANESSMETDSSAWSVVSGTATLANSAAQAQHGTKSTSITRNTTTGDTTISTAVGSAGFRVAPGMQYTFSAYARANSTTRNFKVGVAWYDVAGALIGAAVEGSTVSDSAANFNSRASVTAVAPVNAVFAAIRVTIVGAVATEVHYVDSVMVNRGGLVAFTLGIGLDTWTYEIYRSIDNVVFELVRGGDIVNTGLGAEIYDYELPFLKTGYYRAISVSNDSGGEVASGFATATATAFSIKKVWLKDPIDPTNNSQFPSETDWLPITETILRAEHRPLGRSLPVVVRSVGGGEKFAVAFTVEGEALFQKLQTMLKANHTLLLQSAKRQWYVEVSGDYTIDEHLWDELTGELPLRRVTVPFVEVMAP